MDINTDKSLEEKNLIERFTNPENGQFKVGSALLFLENKVKDQEERIKSLEEAMMFFSEWYNKTQRVDIILPDNLDSKGNTKLILE